MLYNLVAKEFMIARYLKLSKNYTSCNCWEIDRAGKGRGSELLLQPCPGAAVPSHSWLSPWGLGGICVSWKIPRGGMLVGRVLFVYSPHNCRVGWGSRSQLSDGIESWDR